MRNEILEWVAWVLVIIGGLNWGLYGLFKFNLVETIFGAGFLSRLIYIIVGIAACYMIYLKFQKSIPA